MTPWLALNLYCKFYWLISGHACVGTLMNYGIFITFGIQCTIYEIQTKILDIIKQPIYAPVYSFPFNIGTGVNCLPIVVMS